MSNMFITVILFKIFKLSKYKNEHSFEDLEEKKKSEYFLSFISLFIKCTYCLTACHFLWKYYLIIGSLIPLQKIGFDSSKYFHRILLFLILFSHVNLTHFLNSLPVHRHSWNTKIFNEKCPLMMSSNTWTGQSDHFVFRASFHSQKQPNSKPKMLSSVTSLLDVITATGVAEAARIKDLSLEERLAMFRYQFWEEQFTTIAHENDSKGENNCFILCFIFTELSFYFFFFFTMLFNEIFHCKSYLFKLHYFIIPCYV